MPLVLEVRVLRGHGGGPEKTLARSASYLRKYGWNMICAYLCDPRDEKALQTIERLRNQAVEVHVIEDRGLCDYKPLYQLHQLLRHVPVSIYHSHDYKGSALAPLVAHNLVRVATLHGWVHYNAKLRCYYAVEKQCLPQFARLYCVSHQLYQWARRLRGAAQRAYYLPNGIVLEEYNRTCDCLQAREKLGLPCDGYWIGSVGRLSPEKNFSALLKTIYCLRADGYPVWGILVGDGPLRMELEAEAWKLGIRDNIVFAGHQSDVRSWLQCMDIYLCPSLREGMPNSVLEAMAMEVPVIATPVGDLPYMIRNKQEGILLNSTSVEEMIAAVKTVLSGQVDKQRLAQQARRRVEEKFSFEKRMNLLVEDYAKLLEEYSRKHKYGAGKQ